MGAALFVALLAGVSWAITAGPGEWAPYQIGCSVVVTLMFFFALAGAAAEELRRR